MHVPTSRLRNAHPTDRNAKLFPENIETPRLKLRAPVYADAEAMFASYTQEPDLARYMVWQPPSFMETTRAFVRTCEAQWCEGSAPPYIITPAESGALLGMLKARLRRHVVDIGYVLARSDWWQGLMVEAIHALTTIALPLPGILRVEATCYVEIPLFPSAGEERLRAGRPACPLHRASEHLRRAPRLLHLRGLPALESGRMQATADFEPTVLQ